MNTSITSNWRRLLPALYASLIVIATLCAIPRHAQAQLYVTQTPLLPLSQLGIVSEYDPVSGAKINESFIGELNIPDGLALSEDKKLFFVSNYGGDAISKFDATTGAEINRAFITGVHQPIGLAATGNLLYVVRTELGTAGRKGSIGLYYSDTGAKIRDFKTGLDGPYGLAVSYPHIFVSLTIPDYVASYEDTGATNFVISGLGHPLGLATDGVWLYVANGDGVSKFHAFLPGGPSKRDFITGLTFPLAVAVWRNSLFVLYVDPVHLDGRVGKYSAITGAEIKKDFITGLRTPLAIAAKD